ncbi:hypothetical protein BZA70DRAFT_284919 [Myxozyma melibiosi]|uniref:RRM domain-containing protein n=1 Tax=Myxozyma melibiosi TaxID=54550 RepID=A0ABR1EYT6_9ASCO
MIHQENIKMAPHSRTPSPGRSPSPTRTRSVSRGRSLSPRPLSDAGSSRKRISRGSASRSPSRSPIRSRSRSRGRSLSRSRSRSYSSASRSYSRSRSRSRSYTPRSYDSRSLSRSRSRSRSPPYRGGRARSPARSLSPRGPALMPKRLCIQKLSPSVNESHLREIFSAYGRITDLLIPRGPRGHRGICYMSFETEEEADKAIAHMDGGIIDGSEIDVEHATPPPRARGPRNGPGPRNGGGPPRGGRRGGWGGNGRMDSYVPGRSGGPASSGRRWSRSPPPRHGNGNNYRSRSPRQGFR